MRINAYSSENMHWNGDNNNVLYALIDIKEFTEARKFRQRSGTKAVY